VDLQGEVSGASTDLWIVSPSVASSATARAALLANNRRNTRRISSRFLKHLVAYGLALRLAPARASWGTNIRVYRSRSYG